MRRSSVNLEQFYRLSSRSLTETVYGVLKIVIQFHFIYRHVDAIAIYIFAIILFCFFFFRLCSPPYILRWFRISFVMNTEH